MPKNIIFGLPNSQLLARSIAKKAKVEYSEVFISQFPDGETYLRFMKEVKGKNVFIVQTLHPNSNKAIIELLFAVQTAKDLGARKVHVFTPYLAYMRQDARFKSGESISSRIVGKLLSCADSLATLDPHLHRNKSLNQLFKTKTKLLHATDLFAEFIKKNFPGHILIGPDIESHQWVSAIAKQTKQEFLVLRKKRFSSRKVKISIPNYNFKNKKLLIIVENAVNLLKKAGVNKILCTNSIQSKHSNVDISKLFSELVK